MQFENIQIDIQKLPSVSTLVYQKIDSSYLKVMLIKSTIFLLLLLTIVAIIFITKPVSEIPNWGYNALVIVAIFYTALSYLFTIKGFHNKSYALRSNDVIFNSGWLWKSKVTTPFNRIQHVSIEQGILERNWKLARLKLYTAGGSSSDLSIPGLHMTIAQELKEYITNKTSIGDRKQE